MSELYSLAREKTGLNEVQLKILGYMTEALQFAADISKCQVVLCTKGKNKDMCVLLSSLVPSYYKGLKYFHEGDVFLKQEFAIATKVFSTGEKAKGRKELDLGKMVDVTAYPVFDNAGITFAVVGFISNSLEQEEILTDTANMALQIPFKHENYYKIKPQDGVVIIDSVGRVLYTNDMAQDLFLDSEQRTTIGQGLLNHTSFHISIVDRVESTIKPEFGDEISGQMTFSSWALPIVSNGRVNRTVLVLTDVTAVREKERQLLIKDSVIKEIHHRVKNSLNTIAGMLRMQARRTRDEEAKKALKSAINRISGISRIHDILAHQSEEIVNWKLISDKICNLSVESLSDCKVNMIQKNSKESIYLPSEKIVSLGIVTNELIHNAIEHGFENMSSGSCILETEKENNFLKIIVMNDGHLLPESFNEGNYDLGLHIVKTITEIDLKGSFEIRNSGKWVSASICIPINEE